MTTQRAVDVLEKCKIEAKRLVGYSTAVRRLHWSHSCVVSFCAAVEEVVSFGVRKKFQTSLPSWLGSPQPPSVLILKHLALEQHNELASKLWKKAAEESKKLRDHNESDNGKGSHPAQLVLEEKIIWVKVALLERILLDYIELLALQQRTFYTSSSIIGDPVQSDIFQNLLAGPMVIRITKVKTADASFMSPSPYELVHRHSAFDKKKKAPGTRYPDLDLNDEMDLWSHVKSLYQTSNATCLFGKNNILMKLTSPSHPRFTPGYLSLHKTYLDGVELKWIPVDMLNSTQDDPSMEPAIRESLKYVMTIKLEKEIVHIHCHRSSESQYFMIFVGFDGIAKPPLIFHHQSTLLNLLECIDNGLLPQGCLEPPVWFLKNQIGVSPVDGPEGEELKEPWNQVFHIRTVYKQLQDEPLLNSNYKSLEMTEEDLESIKRVGMQDWKADSESEEDAPHPTTPERPHIQAMLKAKRAVNRERLVDFQNKVSKPLIATYFYNWLSYCRHISKARSRVTHMLNPDLTPPLPVEGARPLSKEEWGEVKISTNEADWRELHEKIYLGGVDEDIRREVWPYLLGVYPHGCGDTVKEEMKRECSETFEKQLSSWQVLETVHLKLKELLRKRTEISASTESTDGGSSSTLYDQSVNGRPHLEISDRTDGVTGSGSYITNGNGTVTMGDHFVTNGIHDVIDGEGDSPIKDQLCTQDNHLMESNGSVKTGMVQSIQSHKEEMAASKKKEKETKFRAEICTLFEELPVELQSVLKCEEDNGGLWNFQKFFDLPAVQYLMAQLTNIDKDVRRCDRDFPYFQKEENLTKVRNIVATYCWVYQDLGGYVQGMCDILSPLLVTMDDCCLTYKCFAVVMDRMKDHFPPNLGVTDKMRNLRALAEVLEPEFFQHLSQFTAGEDFLFVYRWFLLDFKREFNYCDLFRLWETIWSAGYCATSLFQEFLALALIKHYMAVILSSQMDMNEMLQLFNNLANKGHEGNMLVILKQTQSLIRDVFVKFVKKD